MLSNHPWENSAHFLQLMPFPIFPIFMPQGTHHCWVDRGSMVHPTALPLLMHTLIYTNAAFIGNLLSHMSPQC